MNNKKLAYLLFAASYLLLFLTIFSLMHKVQVANAKCFEDKLDLGEFIVKQSEEIKALQEENALLKTGLQIEEDSP